MVVVLMVGCGPSGDTLPELMESAEDKGFSGSVLVVRQGDVILDAAYGEAIRERQPFRTDTVSSMGSLTKQFTGAAVLAAQEDGLLSTSDRIDVHLDGVPKDKAGITIHQLLTHQSGLPGSIGPDEDPIGREAWLRDVWDANRRDSDFRYSNVGYGVAAAVLEEATGQDYETYLRERLLLPAGIDDTGYDDPDWSDDVVAHGYKRGREYGPPLAIEADRHWHIVGNGELLTTTADLHAWVMALHAGDVLTDESMDVLWREQVSTGDDFGYSYGWGIEQQNGGRVVEHDGSNGFYFAHAAWFVDEELFVAFLANDYRGWQPGFLWDIAEVTRR